MLSDSSIKRYLVCRRLNRLRSGGKLIKEENVDKLSDNLINKLLECNNALEFLYDTYIDDDSANILNELAIVIDNLEFKIKSS